MFKEMFSGLPDDCVPNDTCSFSWTAKGVGWGGFVLCVDQKNDKIRIDNEIMSKGFIKTMLCRMVDNAELIEVVSEETAAKGEQKFKDYVAGVGNGGSDL